jgi:dihydrodipicolinate synthase/N-acetylneuraminate lyase
MNTRKWWGAFAIPMTPFDNHDLIDEDVLAAEIEFMIGARAQGIVTPVMVSEFFQLSEAERKLMIRLPVDVSHGRVAIIANCAAVNAPLAVEYAVYAQTCGADAVIAMPPYIGASDSETVFNYYKAINEAVTIPIWIQNAGVAALGADQIVDLCTRLEHVSWVKEEVAPSTKAIGRLIARNCPHVEGVMGGAGGRYLITEWERGAVGCVHACEFTDLIQGIFDQLKAGNNGEARDLYDRLLPGVNLEGIMGMAFAKEIMIRRGVFKNNRVRTQSRPLDEHDMHEIDAVWERIQPSLTWHK